MILGYPHDYGNPISSTSTVRNQWRLRLEPPWRSPVVPDVWVINWKPWNKCWPPINGLVFQEKNYRMRKIRGSGEDVPWSQYIASGITRATVRNAPLLRFFFEAFVWLSRTENSSRCAEYKAPGFGRRFLQRNVTQTWEWQGLDDERLLCFNQWIASWTGYDWWYDDMNTY